MATDWYIFYQQYLVIGGLLSAIARVILAIAVWTSQPPPRRVLVGKRMWGFIVLTGGVTAGAIYWVLHYGLITRVDRSVCGVCGYDRKGLSAAAPCPECGTP